MDKVSWSGTITSVQPRIRLLRSFDERSHSYLGYLLSVDGEVESQQGEFLVAIGNVAQQKHEFRAGDLVSGCCQPVADVRLEIAHFYRASRLQVIHRGGNSESDTPPWLGVAPPLTTYRSRGHRRLSARTYASKCKACIWGCRMPVEIIVDHWNPGVRRYRTETFCYGPRNCRHYRAGPARTVPGRKGMVYEEPDWVDEQETSHRSLDE